MATNFSIFSYDFIITEIKAKLNSTHNKRRQRSGDSSGNETDPMSDPEDSWHLVDELEADEMYNGDSDNEPTATGEGRTHEETMDFSEQQQLDDGYITIYKVIFPCQNYS